MKTKTVRFYLRQSDINSGTIACARKCPVARAVARKLGLDLTKDDFDVLTNTIRLGNSYIIHPKAVNSFIQNFDDKNIVKPFGFRLKVPVRVLDDLI